MFCENCGRQLLDGEVCTCTQQTPVTSEQPAPAPQAPEAPQPQLYQPQPQPVYQPTPEPAPAPAPAPTPVYQQPAPAPAPQPAYQQPAPAPAPQPAYQQPAPAPAYQPAYQPVQPSAYQPVTKPVAEKPSSFGKPRYNLMAQLLSSPVILVFGILYAVSILFQLISVASSFSILSVFSLILILLDCVFIILLGQLILQFHRDDGQTVQKNANIQRQKRIELGILQLSRNTKDILFVQDRRIRVFGGRPDIEQIQLQMLVSHTFAEQLDHAVGL